MEFVKNKLPWNGKPWQRNHRDDIGSAILPTLEKKEWVGRTASSCGDHNDDQPI